ncbi:hypothetical protein SAMN05444266_102169 [Chitinophaga jiangningensis]|uniref:Cyd operon protein YbgE (Cyd_oper_YbgE) n=1 Tax=Chitinophaga jiangningensis TaxID=1419482 RepID=A0A1M6Y656_9BACT|nr:hypothetical protein [Chitinophaga jiangningensis]SHL13721.1 hypothetical protein SAMN05444266_102169 [Chitinophaga jiangningensis]
MRKQFLFNILLFLLFLAGTLLVIHFSGTPVNPWIGRFCLLVSCLLHLIAFWAKNFGSVNHRIMVFQSWLVIGCYVTAGFII